MAPRKTEDNKSKIKKKTNTFKKSKSSKAVKKKSCVYKNPRAGEKRPQVKRRIPDINERKKEKEDPSTIYPLQDSSSSDSEDEDVVKKQRSDMKKYLRESRQGAVDRRRRKPRITKKWRDPNVINE